MSKVIGIDLGTTNSAVAVMESSGPDIIENAEGASDDTVCCCYFKTKDRLVGVAARRQAVTNPTNTVYGIKRFVGHAFDDTGVQEDVSHVSFPKKFQRVKMAVSPLSLTERIRPEEISAMILRKMKDDAKLVSVRQSQKQLSLFPHTLMTRSESDERCRENCRS